MELQREHEVVKEQNVCEFSFIIMSTGSLSAFRQLHPNIFIHEASLGLRANIFNVLTAQFGQKCQVKK